MNSLSLDSDIKKILFNYNYKVKEFFTYFDEFTIENYNRKLESVIIKNIIDVNQINKTRELKFFNCLIEYLKTK